MTISWFCIWEAAPDRGPVLDIYDRQGLIALLRGCPGLILGHVMTPTEAHDPYYADRAGSPVLILQLEFSEIAELENCIATRGYLACLSDPDAWPSLAGATISHQAMLVRRYPVADPTIASADGNTLSYMVEYRGPAEDENAWHRFYIDHHPGLLAKFPNIRAIEIYTPAVVVSGLPFAQRRAMQRNKIVFDSPDAMNRAMKSPVRDALRADFHKFPRFEGATAHYPFLTVTVAPQRPAGL